MSSTSWTILALVVYFVAMIGIGLYAFRKTTSHEGYMPVSYTHLTLPTICSV